MVHMTCVNKSPTIPECDDSDLEARVEALEECCEEVHTELDNKADADDVNTELESIRAELNTLIAGWHYVGEVEDEESLPTTLTEGEVYYSLEDNGFYVAVSDDPNNGWRFISGVKSAIAPIHLEDGVISHDDSGVTAGTYGDTTNQTPDFGETFKAVSATVDSKGHVTSISEHTVELPDPYDLYDTKCGDIVTIDDAEAARVKSLTVSLSPVQDNKYDSVWTGGAGKNKLAPYMTNSSRNGITYTANEDGTFTANGTATDNSQILSGYFSLPVGTYILSGCPIGGATSGTYYYRVLIYNGSTIVDVATDTGSEATFTVTDASYQLRVFNNIASGYTANNLMFRPMIRLSTESADFEPYSNIVPITGHDSVGANVTGKNLFGFNADDFANGTTYGVAKFVALYVKAGNYVMSSNAPTGNVWFGRRIDGELDGYNSQRVYDGNPIYISMTSDGYLVIGAVSTDIAGALAYENQIERGSTATAYAPYTGTTYETDLEQTVYGGDADVVNGTGTSEWANIASYNGETITEPWLSSMDVYSAGATPTTGAQVVYKLATPTDLTFTPQQVSLNSGTNNVWSDGYTCVEYMKDKGELTDTLAELQDCCQGGALIVHSTAYLHPSEWKHFSPGDYSELDATYDEIKSAWLSGKQVILAPSSDEFSKDSPYVILNLYFGLKDIQEQDDGEVQRTVSFDRTLNTRLDGAEGIYYYTYDDVGTLRYYYQTVE